MSSAIYLYLEFKTCTPRKIKDEILDKFASLECHLKNEKDFPIYAFQALDLFDDFDGEKIYEIVEEYKHFINNFCCSLWLLGEPYYDLEFAHEKWRKRKRFFHDQEEYYEIR